MIDKSFAEAQLDECDLTLKDLHAIAGAFTGILNALYHQRIDYGDKLDQSASEKKAPSSKTAGAGEATVHRLKFPQG